MTEINVTCVMEITFFDSIMLNIFRNFNALQFPELYSSLALSLAIYYFTLVILSICAHTHDVISFNRKKNKREFFAALIAVEWRTYSD